METLSAVIRALQEHGCVRGYFKRLAANDNSKNQVYLGGDFMVLGKLPMGPVSVDTSSRGGSEGRPRYKSSLNFAWLTETGDLSPAPESKLVLYPDYPEVRLSGFLLRSPRAPSPLMRSREAGRVLLLGVTSWQTIVAFVAGAGSQISRELEAYETAGTGVLVDLPVPGSATTNTDLLIREFTRIHKAGWLTSRQFNARGQIIPCRAPNCGGYTLEVELGVRPSGRAEPDYLGWEVKQFTVTNFARPSGVLTLMTPEPDRGLYRAQGVETFLRTYGYPDRTGRPDRLNFGGIHRAGTKAELTQLTMTLRGFDPEAGTITDVHGGIALIDAHRRVAAEWSFQKLIEHWGKKHAQTVFVMSQCRKDGERRYRYGPRIYLARGADFLKVLAAFARGTVYYDPAIKLESASSDHPRQKRRSQFRTRFADASGLYQEFEAVELA